MAEAIKGISLDSLDLTAKCEVAHEFQYLDPKGRDTGVYISVLGSDAEKVQKFENEEANKRNRQQLIEAEKQVDGDGHPAEDLRDLIIRQAAVRMCGWRGIDQPFTEANALKLCKINSEIRKQVFKESQDLRNFMKGK